MYSLLWACWKASIISLKGSLEGIYIRSTALLLGVCICNITRRMGGAHVVSITGKLLSSFFCLSRQHYTQSVIY
jgi:hypothetical protein